MAGVFILQRFHRWKAERGFFFHPVEVSCLLASLLVCSCATPYRPLDHRYGYSELQITNDVYEVSFLGNASSSYERVSDFALLRTAEIALSQQARSFILLDVANLSSARAFMSPPLCYRTSAAYLSASGQNTLPAATLLDGAAASYLVMEPAQERTFYRPGVKLRAQLLSEAPGTYYPYEPAKESERLRRKYTIKPDQR